jgi:hypothetical protein
MNKNLKIAVMFFIISFIVFSAGCTGNTQSKQNPEQGTPVQKTTQNSEDNNMMPHHRPHINGSERPYWNNTSGRPQFNGSEKPYWNNTSRRPNWNGSGNINEQTST